jgi:hypothetical protein
MLGSQFTIMLITKLHRAHTHKFIAKITITLYTHRETDDIYNTNKHILELLFFCYFYKINNLLIKSCFKYFLNFLNERDLVINMHYGYAVTIMKRLGLK